MHTEALAECTVGPATGALVVTIVADLLVITVGKIVPVMTQLAVWISIAFIIVIVLVDIIVTAIGEIIEASSDTYIGTSVDATPGCPHDCKHAVPLTQPLPWDWAWEGSGITAVDPQPSC